MKILITNDDGIQSESLRELALWASTKGEVTVIAPKVEQSGKSQSIDLFQPFEVKPVDYIPGVESYSLNSTPADCIRFALFGMDRKFDLVLSGINRGFNIGQDIIYSGTVGACFEAVGLGVKAVALSTDPKDYRPSIAKLESIYEYFVEHDLLSYNDIYNVNIPLVSDEIRITRQGGPYYQDKFILDGEDTYRQVGICVYKEGFDMNLDTDAVIHGKISVTPLTIQRTQMDAYQKLLKLNK